MVRITRLSDLITRKREGVATWAFALALFATSIMTRFALSRWLETVPFLTFFPAIVASTLFCGWRQGTLVLLLSVVVAWYFFIPPAYSLTITHASMVELIGFLIVGGFDVVLVAALAELVRRSGKARRVQDSLFHELQHRVANNMQIVASMLQHSRRSLRDPAAAEIIDQAAARIVAMGQLHRRLYDRSAYLHGLEPILRDVLAETLHGLPVDIRLDIRAEDLSIDQMTAILLLVNEAAINAAKHVFGQGKGTFFKVSLFARADGRMQLIVRDDGPGIAPAHPSEPQTRTLGMAIMQAFACQLGGSLEVLDEPGTALTVQFAIKN
jgi:two-component sensor histidine kinase